MATPSSSGSQTANISTANTSRSVNSLTGFFAHHPTAANLLMAGFLILGLISLPQLQRQTFPDTQAYEIRVTVPYPGATPDDVESGICLPLEDAMDSIAYAEEIRCDARDNVGQMTLKMQSQGDFDDFLDDIRAAVDGISNFPDDAETATILELGRTSPVVTVALSADLPTTQLKDLAKQIQSRMQQDAAIPLVTLEGFSERQLRVSIRTDTLRRYQLSLDQLAAILQKQNLDLPLGTFVAQPTASTDSANHYAREYSLRLNDQQTDVQALGNLVIISNPDGAEIRLHDLATITDTFEDNDHQVIFDGQRAALLRVAKNSTDDSLRVLDAVEAFIDRETPYLPAGSHFVLTQNFTDIVKDRLSMLINNAWQGLLLVFLTLMLFFGFRYTFWVVMGLPVSFLASFFLMLQFGISINMMSMVALLLALGILMDDAIVIAESIAEQRQRGLSPLDAVVTGTRRVARGVLSSFLTTVMVFGALIGLEGQLGQVFRVVPIVLIVVLSISLIEAFLILPHHLRHTMEHEAGSGSGAQGNFQKQVNRRFEQWKHALGSQLEIAIRYRYLTVGITIAVFLLCISMLVSGVLKFNALPEMDGDVLEARVILAAGTPLAQTMATMTEVEAALQRAVHTLDQQESSTLIRHTNIRYSQNADAFEQGPHLATLSVDLLTAEARHTSLDTLTEHWQAELPALPQQVTLSITEPALGPAGRAIELRLSGVDRNSLQQASRQLQYWLAQYHGVFNVFDDSRPGKPELMIQLKPEARALGLDGHTIASQLRTAYSGLEVTSLYRGGDELQVVVQLDNRHDTLADLADYPLVNPATGQIIPLASVATLSQQRHISRIHRINHQPTITLFASLNKLKANTGEVVNDTLQHMLPQLQAEYPGLQLSVQGELQRSAVTQDSLKTGLLLGLCGVFILLSLQFRSYIEPLIVMVSIPMALIGVIIGHLLMGHDLSMPSMVGFVSLAGIVVNNAILLVEFVKQHVRDGMDLHAAARQASQDRLRAILLTTSTTVAGTLPLLFETSLQAQVLIPLIISVTFGLLIATFLVLVLLPCLYTILEDIRTR
ncbi:efflux RND transporter permease subunit [Oceanobacter sp. 5_MG-2023]|uniref:efflux RND transporter permease subunit n=2 Tax=Gammaproteobacteria TaxID=1236 RepID=UPI0026E3FA8D|nr:efflux RND transporter permease subunit [Oceanobacter sp. 5_MG-2023]MDO6681394.1 efflux RND transporter permease subunit [Oceanobacter sp. 5_MG-2023]